MIDVVLELTRITQAVSMVSHPTEQVSIIVDEISRCLDIDVCSLYRIDTKGNCILLASHGLNTTRPVNIPQGRGLVGLVVKNRHTINLSNGLKHPDYYHVADIAEESFKSFCGAPLVTNGEVIGVLVVQSKKAKKLSEKHEAFMTTMASHIALIVKQLPKHLSLKSSQGLLRGIAASEGIAIGYPYICKKVDLSSVSLSYNTDAESEISRWKQLLNQVLADLNREKHALGNNLSVEIGNMFDAYKMLLFDKILSDRVENSINEGFSLPSALKHAIQHFAELFLQMEDVYLKARSEDVWHIGNKLYQSFLGDPVTGESEHKLADDIILIAHEVSVSDIADLPIDKLKGIVCAGGSRLSHTAIVANALGIPAVMGVQDLLDKIDENEVIVDGTEAKVYLNPSDTIRNTYADLIEKQVSLDKALDEYKHLSAETKSGTQIQLLANSGLLSDISPGIRHGAEGIGLFRTEIPFIVSDTFPTEEEQLEIYKNVLQRYKGKPVYMRTLDIGGDKQLPYFPISGEENPAMGWRGIRFTLDNVQLLMTQIRAMLRAAESTNNLKIVLPMVSSISELISFHNVLNDALLQLNNEHIHVSKPDVGVMIEIPAAISQLKFWAKHIDFISIGSNDLSQYLLALDRNNPRVAARFDHVHPAVISEIHRIVRIANDMDLPVCVCGEMASDPVAVLLLISMGVRKLSVSSSRIPKMKQLIRNLDEDQLQHFLSTALELDTAEKIRLAGTSLLARLSDE